MRYKKRKQGGANQMKIHELTPAADSNKAVKRIGRGHGSGNGKTAGKGHKGQNARSGGGVRPGFEGGQMPLQRRMPKFGFKNINRQEFKAVNVGDLQKLAESKGLAKIDVDVLLANGLVSANDKVKILGNGKLSLQLEVEAHAFSKSAIAAIEGQNGKVVTL